MLNLLDHESDFSDTLSDSFCSSFFQKLEGHIFICQLALLLRRVLEMLLKLSGIQMTSRKALRQVKSVRIVKKTLSGVSSSLWQINEVPEESHRIFDAVGIELQQLLRNLQLPLPP
jgi:hypothetical protein